MSQNGQQKAQENFHKFGAWIEERKLCNDWKKYARKDKLNRSEIAKECGFALSVLRQNPAVKTLLNKVELELKEKGHLEIDLTSLSVKAQERRSLISNSRDRDRVKALEEQLEALKNENAELKQRLKEADIFNQHLAETGRAIF
jgi:F0F1-type ATP synthase delta subunit